MEEDAQARADELEALTAIYGDEAVAVADDGAGLTLTLPDSACQPQLLLRVHLPDAYPSQHAPVFELSSNYAPPGLLAEWSAELEAGFCPGEVCLYSWAELLRERWEDLTQLRQVEADAAAEAEALGAALEAAALGEEEEDERGASGGDASEALQLAMAEVVDTIVHGQPFTEKRSTFQAHLAPCTRVEQVEAFMELLLQNNKVRQATHNILAYRIERHSDSAPATSAPTFLQDFDDDGEDAAGGRLLHMLQLADARNVVVVVSRWYGGILLGPARFAHINNAARQLLEACGYISSGGNISKKGGGKGKR